MSTSPVYGSSPTSGEDFQISTGSLKKECQQSLNTEVERQHAGSHRKYYYEDPSSCGLCDYVAPYKAALMQHMNTHTGEKPFQCHLCEMSYANTGTLYRHLQRHTKVKSAECADCGKRFYSKGDLTRHIKSHMGTKEFHCNLCNIRFTRKRTRDVHVGRIHGWEKPRSGGKRVKIPSQRVPCQVCKGMYHKSSLKSHMRLHTKEKPYACHHCSKHFRDYRTLSQHLRIHNNSGRYFCRVCKLDFDISKELRSHYRTEEHRKVAKSMRCSQKSKPKSVTNALIEDATYVPKHTFEHRGTSQQSPAMINNEDQPERAGRLTTRNLRTRYQKVSYNEDDDDSGDDVLTDPSVKQKKKKSLHLSKEQQDCRGNNILADSQTRVCDVGLENINLSHFQKVTPLKEPKNQKNTCICNIACESKRADARREYLCREDFKKEEPAVDEDSGSCHEGSGVKLEAEVNGCYYSPDFQDVKVENYDVDAFESKDEFVSAPERLESEEVKMDIKEEYVDYAIDASSNWQLLDIENILPEEYVTDRDLC